MAKGQQRSNKEARKPKADKKAKAPAADTGRTPMPFKNPSDKKKG